MEDLDEVYARFIEPMTQSIHDVVKHRKFHKVERAARRKQAVDHHLD